MIPEDRYKMILEEMPIVCIDCAIAKDSGEYLLVKRNNHPLKLIELLQPFQEKS